MTLASSKASLSLSRQGDPNFALAGGSTATTGLRSYSPELGRWVNQDPIGEKGGQNLLSFVANNCLNYVDLRGLSTIPWEPTPVPTPSLPPPLPPPGGSPPPPITIPPPDIRNKQCCGKDRQPYDRTIQCCCRGRVVWRSDISYEYSALISTGDFWTQNTNPGWSVPNQCAEQAADLTSALWAINPKYWQVSIIYGRQTPCGGIFTKQHHAVLVKSACGGDCGVTESVFDGFIREFDLFHPEWRNRTMEIYSRSAFEAMWPPAAPCSWIPFLPQS